MSYKVNPLISSQKIRQICKWGEFMAHSVLKTMYSIQFPHTSPFHAKIFLKIFSSHTIIHIFNFRTDTKQPREYLGCFAIFNFCSVTFSPTGEGHLPLFMSQSDNFCLTATG